VRDDSGNRTVPLGRDVTTIGRLPDCDIVLRDTGASRRHAQIKRAGAGWTLTDLGSTNGTKLNGATVQSRELDDGDRITIGSTVIEFRRS
jgi:pSer/pThr/pTyr-binding forkhead associated (FHA) protein